MESSTHASQGSPGGDGARERRSGVEGRRSRGERAGLDRARIVEAARGLDVGSLTMQAVANELGVNRKALNHHVSDREGLLRLVAASEFESHFAALLAQAELTRQDDWRAGLHVWAAAVRDSALAIGALADYCKFEPGVDSPALHAADRTVQLLLAAGFSRQLAARGLIAVTEMSLAWARQAVIAGRDGGHPQDPEVRRALNSAASDDYASLRSLVESNPDSYGIDQFDASVRLLVHGLGVELMLLHSASKSRD